ncbi:MAG: ABC transporter ATP-binding protein [Janthinobacterium lividum]
MPDRAIAADAPPRASVTTPSAHAPFVSATPRGVPVLSLDDVSGYYGKLCAVRAINLEIFAGETVCIIGPNGAGKTTLLRAISGILPGTTGVIRYNGAASSGRRSQQLVREGLIHVPEGRQIFADMTVEENVRMGAYVFRSDKPAEMLEPTLALFPRLLERRKQLAGTLSGGEQQMVAMARALMGRPKLLMLDEPSMGLAPIVVAEIYRLINVLRERGVTLLLVEQSAELALKTADRALVLAAGELRYDGPSATLKQDQALASMVLGHSVQPISN